MRAPPVFVVLALSSVAACAQLSALFGKKPAEAQPQAGSQQTAKNEAAAREAAAAEEKRRAQEAAEREQREQAMIAEIERLRGEVSAGTGDVKANLLAFSAKIVEAANSDAAKAGKLDVAALSREAAGKFDAALQKDPSLELLRGLGDLPRGAEVDAAFVRACPKLRPRVQADFVVSFVGECMTRAGDDPAKLKWPGVQKDLVAYRKFKDEELRKAKEEEARRAAEEARRAKEEADEAAKAARGESYVAASVFAAGRCNFGNCAKDGWTIDTAAGQVRVRCNFGNCLKDGWVAEFPDGKSARTACSFGDCFKDGWRTDLPDGGSATTRCNFGNCLKDGWNTDIPGLGTASTRCNFQDCLKDGWSTDLPTGGQVRCRCNFQDCLKDGATCD